VNPTKTKSVRNPKSEELEIELELGSGLVVDFIPDFRMQTNSSDHSKVQWRLSGPGTPINVGILCNEFSGEESIHPTIFSSSDV
jgi:hypothetical protein